MNKNSIYAFVKSVTPPFIFSAFKNGRIYGYTRNIVTKILKDKYAPNWHKVTAGPLKGVELYLDPAGEWQKEMLEGKYDDFFFEYLEKINLSGKVVYDIGAHIGFSSLFFAKAVGQNGKVITFEPNIFNIDRIKLIFSKNTELSSRVQLIEAAVSDKDGEDEFIFSSNIDNGTSSGSFIGEAHTIYDKDSYQTEGGFKSSKVKTVRIDDMCGASSTSTETIPEPDVIKMDIEGSEYLALDGAKDTISRKRPLILIEIHSIFNMYKVEEFLRDLDYKLELLKEEKDGRCFFAAKSVKL